MSQIRQEVKLRDGKVIVRSQLGEQKTNSTHGVFGIKKARLLLIPYPTLEEQHRDAQTTQLHLTGAIVEQTI